MNYIIKRDLYNVAFCWAFAGYMVALAFNGVLELIFGMSGSWFWILFLAIAIVYGLAGALSYKSVKLWINTNTKGVK